MTEPTIDDRLQKLWGHLGDMTPDQLRQHVIKIRNERRITKARVSIKKTVKQSSDAAKGRVKKMLGSMDPEAMARILKDLNK
jgi:hypothetical protein